MKTSDKRALCPQCGTELHHNEVGAWCPGYPCRYSVNRDKVTVAAKLARLLWGPIR